MAVEQELENGAYQYARHIDCDKSGRFGFTVRVVPAGDNHLMYTPGLLTWAK